MPLDRHAYRRDCRTQIGDFDLEAAVGSQPDHGDPRRFRHLQHSPARTPQALDEGQIVNVYILYCTPARIAESGEKSPT